ncbi:MAG: hypothetical protein VW709_04535, partial [Rickettsiales bacterium]
IEASAFEYPWARDRPVLLGAQSIEDVEACVVENWNDVKTYIWETNPDAVLRKTTDAYDEQSVPFRKSLGHVAAIACTSADGLADVQASECLVDLKSKSGRRYDSRAVRSAVSCRISAQTSSANRENNGSFLVLPGVWQELA